MTRFHPGPMLRNILMLDGVSCLAAGALMALGGGYLAGLLELPEALLRGAGAFLLIFGGAVLLAVRPAVVARAAVIAVIACNVVWAVESVALLLAGWLAPNAAGVAFVLAQAAWVAALAVVQTVLLKRAAASRAAA
ncbi:hypothetical protein ACFFJB_12260 [Camelimonas abortus]|uniref:Uncharacterized protein n=1 Tax=Camelimonas abortus TaxID=1017184 RepID=A0ABV7LCB4_9HYPH